MRISSDGASVTGRNWTLNGLSVVSGRIAYLQLITARRRRRSKITINERDQVTSTSHEAVHSCCCCADRETITHAMPPSFYSSPANDRAADARPSAELRRAGKKRNTLRKFFGQRDVTE